MAANKKANAIKEAITLTASMPDYAGYADYFLQTETKFRLQNSYSENLTVTLKVWDDKNLAVPYETTVEVPYESAAEVSVNGLFSPLTLAENNELFVSTVHFSAEIDKTEVASGEKQITALPYDYWEGLSGNAGFRAAAAFRLRQNTGKRGKTIEKMGRIRRFIRLCGGG